MSDARDVITKMMKAEQAAIKASMSVYSSGPTEADCAAGMKAAITALSENVSDEMVDAFIDKLEPYSDASGFDYKSAISAAILAARGQ